MHIIGERRLLSSSPDIAGPTALPRDVLPKHSVKSLRILVADDNLVNQKVAKSMRERLGHTVELANNGKEALSAIATAAFDLIMMDVQMPEMDGFEATRRIREREAGKSRIPIIALTAHAMDRHRAECLAAGMDSFVVKLIWFREPQTPNRAANRRASISGPTEEKVQVE